MNTNDVAVLPDGNGGYTIQVVRRPGLAHSGERFAEASVHDCLQRLVVLRDAGVAVPKQQINWFADRSAGQAAVLGW
ncbi:hypothetical protein MMAG44476_21937 [Mycolicibacterium mageritense DSM 44476 = CIP 104973]|uniref:YjjI family glycine radical enzyme n=1 Tax=Mycolicibacterium canariasense TaxID=228230 RepID=A0A100WBA5_MYCCR|nr:MULTISPECIES: hypothetical protein [Mycolicibacterium]MCC9179530.1 hypothetical protein [Mycolicibacterium mageritense]MCV7211465.1 hypothetical protein [Mycolicibacterium canariasense]ORV10496.1 hypothetical protein AWB94_07300 [Mycolicibacterium canariasense]GAS94873.1 YjjI family glycine radical enzyme [Mycolicibacterium canariasense]